MAVFALLFAVLFVLAGVGLALSTSDKFLWLAAFGSWVFSFLASWSIGLYTLVATFVLLALAIGLSRGWIRNAAHGLLAVAVGIAAWAIAIRTIDDFWLFFPLSALGLLFP